MSLVTHQGADEDTFVQIASARLQQREPRKALADPNFDKVDKLVRKHLNEL